MNFELEEYVIGALILKPELVKSVVIPDNCFLDKTNRFMFKLLKKQSSISFRVLLSVFSC